MTCGEGTRYRDIDVLKQATNGGRICPSVEHRLCRARPCPTASPTPAPTPRPRPTIHPSAIAYTHLLLKGVSGRVEQIQQVRGVVARILHVAIQDVQVEGADSTARKDLELQLGVLAADLKQGRKICAAMLEINVSGGIFGNIAIAGTAAPIIRFTDIKLVPLSSVQQGLVAAAPMHHARKQTKKHTAPNTTGRAVRRTAGTGDSVVWIAAGGALVGAIGALVVVAAVRQVRAHHRSSVASVHEKGGEMGTLLSSEGGAPRQYSDFTDLSVPQIARLYGGNYDGFMNMEQAAQDEALT